MNPRRRKGSLGSAPQSTARFQYLVMATKDRIFTPIGLAWIEPHLVHVRLYLNIEGVKSSPLMSSATAVVKEDNRRRNITLPPLLLSAATDGAEGLDLIAREIISS